MALAIALPLALFGKDIVVAVQRAFETQKEFREDSIRMLSTSSTHETGKRWLAERLEKFLARDFEERQVQSISKFESAIFTIIEGAWRPFMCDAILKALEAQGAFDLCHIREILETCVVQRVLFSGIGKAQQCSHRLLNTDICHDREAIETFGHKNILLRSGSTVILGTV